MNENEPEWDARTLAEAERIKADPGRLSAAKSAVKTLVKKEQQELAAMKKVSGQKEGRLKNEETNNGTLDGLLPRL